MHVFVRHGRVLGLGEHVEVAGGVDQHGRLVGGLELGRAGGSRCAGIRPSPSTAAAAAAVRRNLEPKVFIDQAHHRLQMRALLLLRAVERCQTCARAVYARERCERARAAARAREGCECECEREWSPEYERDKRTVLLEALFKLVRGLADALEQVAAAALAGGGGVLGGAVARVGTAIERLQVQQVGLQCGTVGLARPPLKDLKDVADRAVPLVDCGRKALQRAFEGGLLLQQQAQLQLQEHALAAVRVLLQLCPLAGFSGRRRRRRYRRRPVSVAALVDGLRHVLRVRLLVLAFHLASSSSLSCPSFSERRPFQLGELHLQLHRPLPFPGQQQPHRLCHLVVLPLCRLACDGSKKRAYGAGQGRVEGCEGDDAGTPCPRQAPRA